MVVVAETCSWPSEQFFILVDVPSIFIVCCYSQQIMTQLCIGWLQQQLEQHTAVSDRQFLDRSLKVVFRPTNCNYLSNGMIFVELGGGGGMGEGGMEGEKCMA
jgi:hypothetical protein